MSTTHPYPSVITCPAFRFPAASAVVVTSLFGAAAAHLGETPTLVLVAGVIVLTSGATTFVVAPAIGLVGWAFYTGFVVHRYGLLTFDRPDLVRLAGLAALGLLTASATRRTAPSAHRSGNQRD